MAEKTVTIAGVIYPDVPSLSVTKQGGGSAAFVEVSDTTAVASDVAQGKYFYGADGVKREGTASGGGGAVVVTETPDTGGGVIKEITAVDISNDTVDAAHLLSGYTAHDSTGSAITGQYTPPTITLQTKNKTYTPTNQIQTEAVSADSGYDGLQTVNITVDAAPEPALQTKSRTYTPSSQTQTETITPDTGYDGLSSVSVTVDPAAATSKNVQIAAGVDRVATTSYTAVSGQSLTVAKTGTYDVYWTGFRSSTSGTNGSQLYIGSTAYGSAQTTFTNHGQSIHLSNVSLTQGQTVTVRARARGTSYFMYVGNLTIVEA